MTKLKFIELNLSNEILRAVEDMGFEEASPIQAEAIPFILEGKDIIGQAQTGTGKTAAFAIPVIERINPESRDIQAIVLCPTRELVIQVSEEFRKLLKYKENLSVVPIYGGQEIERQLRALKKGPQIIIGTPGRTMDHIRRGSIKTHSIQIVVLDEADEMLDMGFREDLEIILTDTPPDRQTIMFSATMANDIIDLTKRYQKNLTVINVAHKKLSTPKINQKYYEVQEKNKPEVLSRLLDIHNVKLALVFCNTKSQVDLLVEMLKTRGYFADALHGDMSQSARDKVMNGFRNGSVEILVATDVAGRGIDVNNIEAVFNYDLPRDDEDYIHRIGRTARAGKSGMAFTLITGKQLYNLKRIERNHDIKIQYAKVPTIDEIEISKINTYTSRVAEIIEAGHLGKYINVIEQLMSEEYTSLDVAAAMLKIAMEKENENLDHSINFDDMPKFSEEPRKDYSEKRYGSRRYPQNNRFSKRSNKDRQDRNRSGRKPYENKEGGSKQDNTSSNSDNNENKKSKSNWFESKDSKSEGNRKKRSFNKTDKINKEEGKFGTKSRKKPNKFKENP